MRTRLPPKGFTLVELLVVVAITSLLLSILLVSLKKARESSKFAVCGSNLRQVGTAVHLYVSEFGGYIPRGPASAGPFDFAAANLATNQLWIGEGDPPASAAHPRQYNGLGPLLANECTEPKVFFCPSDDSFNLTEELPKIGTGEDAYGSYLYRQLDHLPESAAAGRLDQLGVHEIGDCKVRVEALALDTNSLGPEEFNLHHTNHRAVAANLLFRDGSVSRHRNDDDLFAIPAEAYADFSGIPGVIDQILTNADFAYRGDPADAPKLDPGDGD